MCLKCWGRDGRKVEEHNRVENLRDSQISDCVQSLQTVPVGVHMEALPKEFQWWGWLLRCCIHIISLAQLTYNKALDKEHHLSPPTHHLLPLPRPAWDVKFRFYLTGFQGVGSCPRRAISSTRRWYVCLQRLQGGERCFRKSAGPDQEHDQWHTRPSTMPDLPQPPLPTATVVDLMQHFWIHRAFRRPTCCGQWIIFT